MISSDKQIETINKQAKNKSENDIFFYIIEEQTDDRWMDGWK